MKRYVKKLDEKIRSMGVSGVTGGGRETGVMEKRQVEINTLTP